MGIEISNTDKMFIGQTREYYEVIQAPNDVWGLLEWDSTRIEDKWVTSEWKIIRIFFFKVEIQVSHTRSEKGHIHNNSLAILTPIINTLENGALSDDYMNGIKYVGALDECSEKMDELKKELTEKKKKGDKK